MATASVTSATSNREVELRSNAPEVAPSASTPDRFTVTFALTGTGLLDVENALAVGAAGVGVDRVSRLGTTVSLHGVEQGREREIFRLVQTAIDDVNRSRAAADEASQSRRSATEAAQAASQRKLQAVQDGFASAARAAAPSAADPLDAQNPVAVGEPPDPAAGDAVVAWCESRPEAANGGGS